jgi:IS5 family transposase
MVGARSFPGNPFDGHTLGAQLEQTGALLQDIGVSPKIAVVDPGYRGVDKDIAPVELIHRGKYKTLSAEHKRCLKRREAIEPLIGHTTQDHGMQRCWLKGSERDGLHAVLCAAGFNIRWLMRSLLRQFKASGLRHVFLALTALCAAWLWGFMRCLGTQAVPPRSSRTGSALPSLRARSSNPLAITN